MAWASDYVTIEDLAAYVRVEDVLDDVQMQLAISAASRAVDAETRRQFGQDDAPASRFYTAGVDAASGRWAAQTDDLMTVVGLEVHVDDGSGTYPTEVTDYVLTPRNAEADGTPWTSLVAPTLPAIPDGVRVTARFGWVAVPSAVKQATLLQASRLLSRRDSPYGVAGSPDAGSEMRLLAKVDPDVAVVLRPYKRRWWAA